MGQTLTHGVYLPDEGERNCYNGLAANWSILDGAVGTIAEHTSALSGKAPLVHTHSKADITDFPAYGNTAGTICEGNDSRLSDARTPVAHTHTKSDVTDLLNSNFIPSANNSYDLGSSSYQWNNLYAKNYYYNGTAWGLDKANVWSDNQTYSGVLSLSSSSDVAEQFKQKLPKDVSTSNDAMARVDSLVDSAGHYVVVETLGHWSNYVAKNITLKYKNDSTKQGAVELRLYSDGSGIFYPQSPFGCDLGNIYNKWKTINGINPGALSLPNGNAQDATWSGDLTVKDGSDYNLKTFTLNGWVTINIPNTAGNLIVVNNGCGQIVTNEAKGTTGNNCSVTLPVVANVQISVLLVLQSGESVKNAIFAPCLGNV